MKIIFRKQFFVYLLISMLLWSTISVICYYLFFLYVDDTVVPNYPVQGFDYFISILIHNSGTFFFTIFGFVFSPFIVIWNNLTLAEITASNVGIVGLSKTIRLLLPHAFVEIPTIFTYQYLSLKMFLIFLGNKNIQSVFIFVKENYEAFVLAYVGIIVSAFIEGVFG